MLAQPLSYLLRARAWWIVRAVLVDRYSPMLCGQEADWVTPPCGSQHDTRARAFHQSLKPAYKCSIGNIRKLAAVGRLLAIQHPVDVQKDNLHLQLASTPAAVRFRCRERKSRAAGFRSSKF